MIGRRAGKSAPGYALRGFPHATRSCMVATNNFRRRFEPTNYATLIHTPIHDDRLKPLGKIQCAPLGNIGRAPTHLTDST